MGLVYLPKFATQINNMFSYGYSGWWFQTFLVFTPTFGEMLQFDLYIFSSGLIQPPTSSTPEN